MFDKIISFLNSEIFQAVANTGFSWILGNKQGQGEDEGGWMSWGTGKAWGYHLCLTDTIF